MPRDYVDGRSSAPTWYVREAALMRTRILIVITLIALGLATLTARAADVGHTFVYDGRLWRDGETVSAFADLQFRLFDARTGGERIGGILTRLSTPVLDGRFTARL